VVDHFFERRLDVNSEPRGTQRRFLTLEICPSLLPCPTQIVALRGSQEVVSLAEKVALVNPNIPVDWNIGYEDPQLSEEFRGAAIGRNPRDSTLLFRWAVYDR